MGGAQVAGVGGEVSEAVVGGSTVGLQPYRLFEVELGLLRAARLLEGAERGQSTVPVAE